MGPGQPAALLLVHDRGHEVHRMKTTVETGDDDIGEKERDVQS